MKLLHVSDLHFRQHWFEWVATNAPRFDAVCLTGDLLDLLPTAAADLQAQVRWTTDWLARFPATPLFICSGNHDWWLQEKKTDRDCEARWLQRARRRGVYVDGDQQALAGFNFVCAPWLSTPVLLQTGPTVLLAHAPPERTAVSCRRTGEDYGDFEIAALAAELPPGSFCLSGHVHEPKAWIARIEGTYCFNPGVDDEALVPNHVVISMEERMAEWRRQGRAVMRRKLKSP